MRRARSGNLGGSTHRAIAQTVLNHSLQRRYVLGLVEAAHRDGSPSPGTSESFVWAAARVVVRGTCWGRARVVIELLGARGVHSNSAVQPN